MINGPKQLTDHRLTLGWQEIVPSTVKMGFDYCVYCYVDKDHNKSYKAITSDSAMDWGLHHINSNYSKNDPIVHAGQGKNIFIWNSVKENSVIEKKIIGERSDYGMKSGVTIPIHNKSGKLSAWLSLSCNATYKHFNTLINSNNFYDDILNLHIEAVALSLSKISGMNYQASQAIILSDYYIDIEIISDKTGIAVQDLYKLFGQIYLYYPFLNFLNIAISSNDIVPLQPIINTLNKVSSPKIQLSKRQNECIRAMAEGLTSKQAAQKIGISPRTYEEYIVDVRHIFNCSNQKELLSKLYFEGMLS